MFYIFSYYYSFVTIWSEQREKPGAFGEPDYINISVRDSTSYSHPLIIVIQETAGSL